MPRGEGTDSMCGMPVGLCAVLKNEGHEVDGVGGGVNDRGAQNAQLTPDVSAWGLQVDRPNGRPLQEADRPQRAPIVCKAGTQYVLSHCCCLWVPFAIRGQ